MANEWRIAGFVVLAALAITGLPLFLQLPLWVPSLFCVMLGARALLLWYHWQLPRRLWLFLAMVGPLVLLWLSLQSLIGREGGVALLLLLTGFKAFETVSLRDWRVLLALGFFLAATPLLFDQGVLSALWLLLSLFMLTWAMVLLAHVAWQGSLRQAGIALFYSLPLMLLLFVAMPRLPAPLWGMPTQDKRATSGLSDSMAPGSIGQMIPSREPVFTARFSGRQPAHEQLYWRVMVFDRFDGERWTGSGDYEPAIVPEDTPMLSYTVTASPYKGRLPVLEQAVWAGEGGQLTAGQLLQRVDRTNESRMRYDVRSVAQGSFMAALDAAEYQRYLQLPPGNERTSRQGQQFREKYPQERQRLLALQRWFKQQGLKYTLSPALLQGDIIDGLLFSSKAGFCEHFASAFVVLARSAGLPARVVVGFQGGEFYGSGQFWLVRSSDAHAWVEVWLQQRWQRVDPTTLVVPQRVVGEVGNVLPEALPLMPLFGGRAPGWWREVQAQWQSANFVWQQWVVGYDVRQQRSLYQRLGLKDVSMRSVVLLLLAGAFLLVLPVVYWLLWQRQQAPPLPLRGWYLLVSRLQQAGMPVLKSDTTLQLREKSEGLSAENRAQLIALLHCWQHWRYQDEVAQDDPLWRDWWHQVRRFKPQRLAANKKTAP